MHFSLREKEADSINNLFKVTMPGFGLYPKPYSLHLKFCLFISVSFDFGRLSGQVGGLALASVTLINIRQIPINPGLVLIGGGLAPLDSSLFSRVASFA